MLLTSLATLTKSCACPARGPLLHQRLRRGHTSQEGSNTLMRRLQRLLPRSARGSSLFAGEIMNTLPESEKKRPAARSFEELLVTSARNSEDASA